MQARSPSFNPRTTTPSIAGPEGAASQAALKKELVGLDFEAQEKRLAPPATKDPGRSVAGSKPARDGAREPTKTDDPSKSKSPNPGYTWARGGTGTEKDPIRRKIGVVSLKYLATRNNEGKFETAKNPKVAVHYERVSTRSELVYDDYFEVEIHREVARPDGSGYETRAERGTVEMSNVGELINGLAKAQQEAGETSSLPFWIVRIMRYNPVFQISDNILRSKEFETGKERTGTERVLNCVSAVGDIVSLGAAGKAGAVAKVAHGIKAAAGLAKDAGWIGDWLAGFIQGVAGLASLQAGAAHKLGAWLEKESATIARSILVGIKSLDKAATAFEVSKVIMLAVEPVVWAGVALGLMTQEQSQMVLDVAKAQNAVMESLGVFKAVLDLRKSP